MVLDLKRSNQKEILKKRGSNYFSNLSDLVVGGPIKGNFLNINLQIDRNRFEIPLISHLESYNLS